MNETIIENDYVEDDGQLLGSGYAFVGAVHSLVDASRAATKFDLVLAAASHALRGGGKTLSEVHSVIHRVWPGARVSQDVVLEALELGEELGLTSASDSLGAEKMWQLTERGVDDVENHVRWASSLRARSTDALRQRAESDLGVSIPLETAELWMEQIVSALILGITAGQDAYLGEVDHLVGKRLAPRKVDRARVLSHLGRDDSDPAVVEFLKATALAALDPLDLFCSDLVSHITTGCVLHSYVAGRDSANVLDALGTPRGQRALIDTPVLVDLIGPSRVRKTIEFTISASIQAGWEVIVCEHSVEELINLVTREVPGIQASFTQANNAGVKEEWFASLSEDQLTSYAVEVLREGTYTSLRGMITAAENIRDTLADLGVHVREHFNEADASYVDRCRRALDEELEGSFRSDSVKQRDADSMAVVWRRRRREPRASAWPGGWIITPDRHLSPAFLKAERGSSIPMTLSMAQWSTLLSVTVAPADVVMLAEAAATQLVEESMWILPSRYPSDVALEIAKRLASVSSESNTEVRYAQLTLDLALDGEDQARSATAVAADVLEARSKRRERFAELSVEAAERMAAGAEASRAAAQSLADSRAAEARESQKNAETSASAVTVLSAELEWERTRVKRILVSVVLLFVGIAMVVFAFAIDSWLVVKVATILGLVGGGVALGRWCLDQTAKLRQVLWGGAVEAIAFASALTGLAVDVNSLS